MLIESMLVYPGIVHGFSLEPRALTEQVWRATQRLLSLEEVGHCLKVRYGSSQSRPRIQFSATLPFAFATTLAVAPLGVPALNRESAKRFAGDASPLVW